MTEAREKEPLYVTVAMAEILLSQNLATESARVIGKLQKENNSPKVQALAQRLTELNHTPEPVPLEPANRDAIQLSCEGRTLTIRWEMTKESLAMAKRVVRYSGHKVVRIFSAVPGPRGVRTWTRDITLSHLAARLDLRGLPNPAVHVAAVGYLCNTGQFVPLARSQPLVIAP